MQHAYLLLGSNLGNRLDYLQAARQQISKLCGPVLAASSIYETEAWGLTNQPSFYNQAICITTELAPPILMQTLLQIEADLHRVRTQQYGSRTIDIDILLIDAEISNTPLLQLPHPALPQRRFALIPLAEIAPQLLHPTAKMTVTELLHQCTDTLAVQKIKADNEVCH